MGLNLEGQIISLVEPDDAGVIFEHRKTEVLSAFLAPYSICGTRNVGSKKALNDFFLSIGLVFDDCIKDLMLAVFRPGLGNGLHFHVSGRFRQACLLAGINNAFL